MDRKIVSHASGHYSTVDFLKRRMDEKARFPRGEEVVVEFEGRDAFEGFGMARTAAKIYSGLLVLGSEEIQTVPFVATLGPYSGCVMGSHTQDGKQGWRIDWKPATDEFHVNWWDRREDHSPEGRRDRSMHYYGANFVSGAARQMFGRHVGEGARADDANAFQFASAGEHAGKGCKGAGRWWGV
jgi:hypothetical protein